MPEFSYAHAGRRIFANDQFVPTNCLLTESLLKAMRGNNGKKNKNGRKKT